MGWAERARPAQSDSRESRRANFNDELNFEKRESLRKATAAALERNGDFETAGKLLNCQKRLTAWKPPDCGPECIEVVPKSCFVRICPHNERRRARRNYRIAQALLPEFKNPQFVTFTIPNVKSLEEGEVLSRLNRDFRKFRQLKSYQDRCRGGLFSVEIPEEGKGWNVHIHALLDFAFWSDFDLAFQWAKVTGARYGRGKVLAATKHTIKAPAKLLKDAKPGWSVQAGEQAFGVVTKVFRDYIAVDWKGPKRGFRAPKVGDSLLVSEARIVHRRSIDGPQALKELCKYVTKIQGFVGDGKKISELLRAIKGRRLFGAVGDFYSLKNEFNRKDEACPFCCKKHGCKHELLGETDHEGAYFDARDPPGQWRLYRETQSEMMVWDSARRRSIQRFRDGVLAPGRVSARERERARVRREASPSQLSLV